MLMGDHGADVAALIAMDRDLKSVYISSPYTSPDPEANVRESIRVASLLAATGEFFPVVPLLTHLWNEIDPHPYEFWIEYTKRLLVGCDFLLRLPGESSGADGEVALARELGIPVFEGLDALLEGVESIPVV